MRPLQIWVGDCPTWVWLCASFVCISADIFLGEMMWRWWVAKCIRFTHLLIMIFIMIGWALPWLVAWWVHVILTPLTRLHWRFNQRSCIFTTWENRVLQNEHIEDHEEGWFVKEMVAAITGWRPPTLLTRRVMAIWMWIATFVSACRIAVI